MSTYIFNGVYIRRYFRYSVALARLSGAGVSQLREYLATTQVIRRL